MDDLARSYEGSQLAPDELAELRAQREAEDQAARAAEYDREAAKGRWGKYSNGPRTSEEKERGAREARGQVIGPLVRERPTGAEFGAHPQSRRNGSGFTGVRPRIKVRWSFGD